MSGDPLSQLRNDALTMLVLWATKQDYSADIETLLKQWAATFNISDAELNQRLSEATNGVLVRPPDSRTGLSQPPVDAQQGSSHAAAAAAAAAGAAGAAGAAAGGGYPPPTSNHKRQYPAADGGGGGGGSSKRFKTIPAVVGSGDLPYSNIGPAIGRKVLRFWPKDAARNKGDPWFTAVVTDYEEATGAHILTYQFGTQREEKERVALALKRPDELRLTDDVLDLLEWYADPKRRRRSSAVEKSVFLRRQYQAMYGSAAPGAPAQRPKTSSKGGGGGRAHSNSALSSGYSL